MAATREASTLGPTNDADDPGRRTERHRGHTAPPGRKATTTHTTGSVEAISRSECLELLASERVGRLAVNVAGRPEIFPVNYTLDETGAVIVETGSGTKLAAAVNRQVAFEVDHSWYRGAGRGSGWSVVVHGIAHTTDPVSLRLADRAVQSWVAAPTPRHTIRIHAIGISGRRIA